MENGACMDMFFMGQNFSVRSSLYTQI